MADSNQLLNLLNPSLSIDQQQIQRRMALADMLRQQSLTPEQTQMAGGMVVPYSPFQGLAKLGQAYFAKRMYDQTDQDRAALAQKQSQALISALGGQQTPQGPSMTSQPVDNSQMSQPGNFYNQPQQAMTPLQQAPANQGGFGPQGMTPMQRMLAYSLDPSAYVSSTLKDYTMTEAGKRDRELGVGTDLARQLDLAQRRKQGMYELAPGSTSIDLATGQERFAPKVGEGITINNGVASQLPGYAQANAGIQGAQAGAIEGAKAYWNPMKLDLPGGPQMSTQGAIASQANRGGVALQTPEAQKTADIIAEGMGKSFNTIQDAGNAANNKIAKAQQLGGLLDSLNSGKLSKTGYELAAFGKSIGIPVGDNVGNAQAAQALSNAMALELRNPSGGAGMPGAMSDADRSFLSSMTPDIGKTPQGNKILIDSMVKLAQRDKEVAQMARDYKQAHGGFDDNFYTQLKQYSEAHPLFQGQAPAGGMQDAIAAELKRRGH
jgi:hypothetical protein